jgi:phenylacetate-CoA ligase
MVNEKLQKIITQAAITVPYYKELFKNHNIDPLKINDENDLVKIPVLAKDIVQNSPEKFLSTEFKRYQKRSILAIHNTSGSSGKCMHIQWSMLDYTRSMFPLWMIRKKIYEIDTNDRLLSFHTNIFANNALTNHEQKVLMKNNRVLSLSNLYLNGKQVEFYYNEMVSFQPNWISGQPCSIFLLADYIKSNNKKVPESLRYIELTGEYLFDNIYNKIKNVFNVPIANMYGMVETNGIACQCKIGNMHILNSNVVVEILNNNNEVVNKGEEGGIFVTSLTNTAMPLIRYETGDRGIIYNKLDCTCGRKDAILKVKAGRISEFIDTQDRKKLTPFTLCYPISIINDEMGNPIKQYQVIQNDINNFTVIIALDESFKGWEKSIKECYCKSLNNTCLNSSTWEFIFRDYIYPDNVTGKYRFFINKINHKVRM